MPINKISDQTKLEFDDFDLDRAQKLADYIFRGQSQTLSRKIAWQSVNLTVINVAQGTEGARMFRRLQKRVIKPVKTKSQVLQNMVYAESEIYERYQEGEDLAELKAKAKTSDPFANLLAELRRLPLSQEDRIIRYFKFLTKWSVELKAVHVFLALEHLARNTTVKEVAGIYQEVFDPELEIKHISTALNAMAEKVLLRFSQNLLPNGITSIPPKKDCYSFLGSLLSEVSDPTDLQVVSHCRTKFVPWDTRCIRPDILRSIRLVNPQLTEKAVETVQPILQSSINQSNPGSPAEHEIKLRQLLAWALGHPHLTLEDIRRIQFHLKDEIVQAIEGILKDVQEGDQKEVTFSHVVICPDCADIIQNLYKRRQPVMIPKPFLNQKDTLSSGTSKPPTTQASGDQSHSDSLQDFLDHQAKRRRLARPGPVTVFSDGRQVALLDPARESVARFQIDRLDQLVKVTASDSEGILELASLLVCPKEIEDSFEFRWLKRKSYCRQLENAERLVFVIRPDQSTGETDEYCIELKIQAPQMSKNWLGRNLFQPVPRWVWVPIALAIIFGVYGIVQTLFLPNPKPSPVVGLPPKPSPVPPPRSDTPQPVVPTPSPRPAPRKVPRKPALPKLQVPEPDRVMATPGGVTEFEEIKTVWVQSVEPAGHSGESIRQVLRKTLEAKGFSVRESPPADAKVSIRIRKKAITPDRVALTLRFLGGQIWEAEAEAETLEGALEKALKTLVLVEKK